MCKLTERILFLKFVRILKFVKIREFQEFLNFIKFEFSIYDVDGRIFRTDSAGPPEWATTVDVSLCVFRSSTSLLDTNISKNSEIELIS